MEKVFQPRIRLTAILKKIRVRCDKRFLHLADRISCVESLCESLLFGQICSSKNSNFAEDRKIFDFHFEIFQSFDIRISEIRRVIGYLKFLDIVSMLATNYGIVWK